MHRVWGQLVDSQCLSFPPGAQCITPSGRRVHSMFFCLPSVYAAFFLALVVVLPHSLFPHLCLSTLHLIGVLCVFYLLLVFYLVLQSASAIGQGCIGYDYPLVTTMAFSFFGNLSLGGCSVGQSFLYLVLFSFSPIRDCFLRGIFYVGARCVLIDLYSLCSLLDLSTFERLQHPTSHSASPICPSGCRPHDQRSIPPLSNMGQASN